MKLRQSQFTFERSREARKRFLDSYLLFGPVRVTTRVVIVLVRTVELEQRANDLALVVIASQSAVFLFGTKIDAVDSVGTCHEQPLAQHTHARVGMKISF